MSTERCPGLSVQSRLCSPHLLPQSPKLGAGRGGGGAGRTVTQMLFWSGGPYRHTYASLICSVSKGEMLSVSFTLCFLRLVRRLSPFFTVLLFLGSLFENTFGSELLFLCVGVVRVFFGAVLPMVLPYYLFCRSRNCLEKFSWCQVWCFWVFSLFLWFFRRRRRLFVFCLFSFNRESLGSNRAHPHTHLVLFVIVLFVVPPRLSVHPFWPCGRASCFFVFLWGAILGPTLFLDSLGILLGPFSGREAARVFLVVSFCCFCLPLLLCFAALFTPTRRGGPVFVRGIPPGRRTRPAPEWGPRGAVERAEREDMCKTCARPVQVPEVGPVSCRQAKGRRTKRTQAGHQKRRRRKRRRRGRERKSKEASKPQNDPGEKPRTPVPLRREEL